MKAQLKYCPDLRACVLEDRLVPVIPNMGVIVLTTGGYVLPPEQVYRGGLPVSASGGVSTAASGQWSGPNPDERPVDPLPIRLQSRPHRLASGRLGVSRQVARIGRRDSPGTPSPGQVPGD